MPKITIAEINIMLQDSERTPLLSQAVLQNREELVNCLLSQGVSPYITNKNKLCALDYVMRSPNVSIGILDIFIAWAEKNQFSRPGVAHLIEIKKMRLQNSSKENMLIWSYDSTQNFKESGQINPRP